MCVVDNDPSERQNKPMSKERQRNLARIALARSLIILLSRSGNSEHAQRLFGRDVNVVCVCVLIGCAHAQLRTSPVSYCVSIDERNRVRSKLIRFRFLPSRTCLGLREAVDQSIAACACAAAIVNQPVYRLLF